MNYILLLLIVLCCCNHQTTCDNPCYDRGCKEPCGNNDHCNDRNECRSDHDNCMPCYQPPIEECRCENICEETCVNLCDQEEQCECREEPNDRDDCNCNHEEPRNTMEYNNQYNNHGYYPQPYQSKFFRNI